MVLSGILTHFTKMRHLSLEFTGCRLEELEISILCHGFKQCSQIEKLTFKLIQTPNIPLECLYELLQNLAEQKNIKEFDLFFTKHGFSQNEIIQLVNKLLDLDIPNIKYVSTKYSLHIFKKEERELCYEEKKFRDVSNIIKPIQHD